MFQWTRTPSTDVDSAPISKSVRRGATAMEYLMMLSLIIVVALAGIGYFGSMTNNVTTATSNAIQKSIKKGG